MLKTVMARSAILALACSLSISAHAMADGVKRAIHIPSGDLASALDQLAKQSGADIVYRPDQLQGLKTRGVDGELSAEEAAARLLEGTSLTLSTDATGAMLIAAPLPARRSSSFFQPGSMRLAQSTEPAPARAQADSANAPEEIAEVMVTGSRIARPMLDSPIPVTTQSASDLFRTGATNVGDKLSQLPALAPTFTQASTVGGPETGSTAVIGLNVLDLRGLGVSRTLTLVDGKRPMTSVEGQFLVDVNTIPNDLIERVDLVTGGSSAVYGSDAMAGVVNFVLKRNFEGLSFNAQGGVSGKQDRGTYKLSGTYGHNFSAGRGNITVALEHDRADLVYLTDREAQTGAFSGRNEFQRVNAAQPGVPARNFVRGVHSFGFDDGGAFIAYNGTSSLRCTVANSCLPNGFPRVFRFLPDGTLTEATYGLDLRPLSNSNNVGGTGSTLVNSGTMVPGLTRDTLNLLGHFDFSDAVRPYFSANFVRILATQEGPATISVGGPQGTGTNGNFLSPQYITIRAPISIDNPYLTTQARTLIQSMLPPGSQHFNLGRFNVDMGGLFERDDRKTYRVLAGVEGRFYDDWHYDVSLDYGKLTTKDAFANNRIEQNFFNAIDAVRNGSGEIVCRLNQVTVTDPACRPLSLLGYGGSGQTAAERRAALDYVMANSHRWGEADKVDFNASVQGNLSKFFQLPGGPVRFAVGTEYRRETAQSHWDDLVTSGATHLAVIQPFDPPAFEVREAYAEVDVPLFKDMPFMEEFSLNGAQRVASYKGSTGTVWAYNGGAIYAPVRDVRFRANYSHSVRAPTLSDLYSPTSTDFRAVVDPCDRTFIGTGTANRYTNCLAAGVPVDQPGGFSNPFAATGLVEVLVGGNPSLEAETSRSWTYGVILQPAFAPGLVATIDYYDIKVSNIISAVNTQQILNGCFDGATLDNSFCRLVLPRDGGGFFSSPAVRESTLNYAALKARGVDVDLSYDRRLDANNKLAVRFIGTYVKQRDNFPYLDTPSTPDRVKGELGTPIYKFNAQADYTYKAFTFGYSLRYLGKQSVAPWESQHVVADIPGTPFDPLYSDIVYYPTVVYHDINLGFRFSDRLNVYAGVNNLSDKLPPYGLFGNGATSAGVGNDAIYDNVGRFVFMGVHLKL